MPKTYKTPHILDRYVCTDIRPCAAHQKLATGWIFCSSRHPCSPAQIPSVHPHLSNHIDCLAADKHNLPQTLLPTFYTVIVLPKNKDSSMLVKGEAGVHSRKRPFKRNALQITGFLKVLRKGLHQWSNLLFRPQHPTHTILQKITIVKALVNRRT